MWQSSGVLTCVVTLHTQGHQFLDVLGLAEVIPKRNHTIFKVAGVIPSGKTTKLTSINRNNHRGPAQGPEEMRWVLFSTNHNTYFV